MATRVVWPLAAHQFSECLRVIQHLRGHRLTVEESGRGASWVLVFENLVELCVPIVRTGPAGWRSRTRGRVSRLAGPARPGRRRYSQHCPAMVGRQTSPGATGRTGRPRRRVPMRWRHALTRGHESTGSGIRPQPRRLPLPGGADLLRLPRTGGRKGIAGPRRPGGAAARCHCPLTRRLPVCDPKAWVKSWRRTHAHSRLKRAAAGTVDPSARRETGNDQARFSLRQAIGAAPPSLAGHSSPTPPGTGTGRGGLYGDL